MAMQLALQQEYRINLSLTATAMVRSCGARMAPALRFSAAQGRLRGATHGEAWRACCCVAFADHAHVRLPAHRVPHQVRVRRMPPIPRAVQVSGGLTTI